jgi:hypothetical protein
LLEGCEVPNRLDLLCLHSHNLNAARNRAQHIRGQDLWRAFIGLEPDCHLFPEFAV